MRRASAYWEPKGFSASRMRGFLRGGVETSPGWTVEAAGTGVVTVVGTGCFTMVGRRPTGLRAVVGVPLLLATGSTLAGGAVAASAEAAGLPVVAPPMTGEVAAGVAVGTGGFSAT